MKFAKRENDKLYGFADNNKYVDMLRKEADSLEGFQLAFETMMLNAKISRLPFVCQVIQHNTRSILLVH